MLENNCIFLYELAELILLSVLKSCLHHFVEIMDNDHDPVSVRHSVYFHKQVYKMNWGIQAVYTNGSRNV